MDFKFVNGSHMPNLDPFVTNGGAPGSALRAEAKWMEEFWDQSNGIPDYGVIDREGHRRVAQTIPPGTHYVHMMHEVGLFHGRQHYDFEADPNRAADLFIEAVTEFREGLPDHLRRPHWYTKISFYDLFDAQTLADEAFVRAYDRVAEVLDFFMPGCYLNTPHIDEFAALVRYRVKWLKSRWPEKEVLLCATHRSKYGARRNEVMTPIEMHAYIQALRASGADGLIWWAGWTEGEKALDQTTTVDTALMHKHWNHPFRWRNGVADWAEALRHYDWVT